MQGHKFLSSAVTICATLVKIQTDRRTDNRQTAFDQLINANNKAHNVILCQKFKSVNTARDRLWNWQN